MEWILFKQVCVLFLIMAAGFLTVKGGLAEACDSRILSLLGANLFLPCVILKGFQVEYSTQIRDRFLLGILAAVLIHAALFAVVYLVRLPLGLSGIEQCSLVYSSAGSMIIPLVTAVLGEDWVVYTCAFLFVQTMLIWTHGKNLVSGERSYRLTHILLNPNILAALAGIACFVARIRIGGIPMDAISSLSSMIGPACMLTLGMILGGLSWREVFGNHRIYGIVAVKMIVIPLCTAVMLARTGLGGLADGGEKVLLVSLMAVITPSASAVVQLAQIYDKDVPSATAINVLTNLVCIATMPMAVWVYRIMI